MSKDPSYETLTPKERRQLGIDTPPTKFKSSTEELARDLTKGMDQKKLERDLRRLERADWE